MDLNVLYTQNYYDRESRRYCSFNYVSLTSKLLQQALDVMRHGFFPHESASRAVDLVNNPEAAVELEGLCINAARDGVSILAIEENTNKVVGVAFNKLQVKNSPGEACYFENYAKSCQHASSRGLIEFMINTDASFDLFEHCNVNCLLEVMFIATLPEYRNKGIGRNLCDVSVRLAKLLKHGRNVKHAIEEGESLPLEPVPQIVSALFTSPTSQKIGRVLNWEIAARRSYEEYFHEGKSFASVLGEDVPDTTLEYTQI